MPVSRSLRTIRPVSQFRSFAEGLDHPEGLAFDTDGKLWAGGEQGQIYCIDRRGRVIEVARIGGFCLGLTFSRDQDLFICNLGTRELVRMNRKGRVLSRVARVGNRKLVTPNFSVFDSNGILYFSDSGEFRRDNGCVYRLLPDGHAEWFAGPFSFANGLALGANEKFLYVVESCRDRVLEVPILPSGKAGKAQVYASGIDTVPDGAAFDQRGNLYVTTYANHRIYRIAPDGSVSLYAFDPDGTMLAAPTNIAFGGPAMDQMYVANLNRWHIATAKAGVRGQLLANFR